MLVKWKIGFYRKRTNVIKIKEKKTKQINNLEKHGNQEEI